VGFTQGVTPGWISLHEKPDIRGIINGYEEEINQISIKYLIDFIRILKNICWIYLNISQISVDSGRRE